MRDTSWKGRGLRRKRAENRLVSTGVLGVCCCWACAPTKPAVVFRLSGLANTVLSHSQGKMGIASWFWGWALFSDRTLSYQFFLLVNADVLIIRFIILTEGQVPFLAVSIMAVLVLIREIPLKWPGTRFIISRNGSISVQKTC